VPGDVIEAIGGKPVMGSRASKRASTTFAPATAYDSAFSATASGSVTRQRSSQDA